MAKPKEQPETPQRPLVDMKSHILTVAASLMLERGIKETSLKDIAKLAGISKGTLYYYYSAKEDLIYDVADRNLSYITDALLSWADRTDGSLAPKELLLPLFEQTLAADDRARLHLSLLNYAVTANPALLEKFHRRYTTWRQTLTAVLDAVLPGGRNAALAHLLLAALDGLTEQKLCGAEALPAAEILDLLFPDAKKG